MRRTLVIAMVTGSLMIGGTGAVLAGGHNDGDNDHDDAGKGQYPCPPNTHGKSCKPCPNNNGHGNGPKSCQQGPKPGSHGSHGSHTNGGQSHQGGSHQSH